MAKLKKISIYSLTFIISLILCLENSFAGILSEDILDQSSIERLKAELSEIDVLTTKPAATTSTAEKPEEDSIQSSSAGVKKMENSLPEGKLEEQEQKLEETSDYINLDQYF
ncbi:MAG: hypothetical protein QE271_02915 [Bacteriovoracaceae bacterium]|nr:hypothetical protein [Bacteriovoracaceae bacterium]